MEENKDTKMKREVTLNEYQAKCHTTRIVGNTPKIVYPALGLAGESGEVCDKIKKVIRDENGKFTEETLKAVAMELGDVMWNVAELAADLGYSLEDIAIMNDDKLQSRKERDVIKGEGDNR